MRFGAFRLVVHKHTIFYIFFYTTRSSVWQVPTKNWGVRGKKPKFFSIADKMENTADRKLESVLPCEEIKVVSTQKEAIIKEISSDEKSFWQHPLFFVVSSIVLSSAITFTNFSRRPGISYLDDLTNGMPERGELGYPLRRSFFSYLSILWSNPFSS